MASVPDLVTARLMQSPSKSVRLMNLMKQPLKSTLRKSAVNLSRIIMSLQLLQVVVPPPR
jgi:hypothetical protein